MWNNQNRSRVLLWVSIQLLFGYAAALAQEGTEPIEVRGARQVIESEKEAILFFAHPTATYRSVRYDGYKDLRDGYSVSYTFNWRSDLNDKDHYTKLAFIYDKNGKLDFIRLGDYSSLFKPFFASNTIVNFLKQQIQKDESLQNDRALMKLLDKDAKSILEAYLRRDIGALATVLGPLMKGGGTTRSSGYSTPGTPVRTAGPGDTELIDLIRGSESMDGKERDYWIKALPKMTGDQRSELKKTLVNEKRQLAEIDKKYGGTTTDSVSALFGEKRYKEVITACTDMVDRNEKDANAYFLRGQAYHATKEYKAAVADFSQAIDLAPKAEAVYRRRASAHVSLKNYRAASVDLTRAIELDPKSALACNGMAWLFATCAEAKFRDGKEAVEYAMKACELTKWKEASYFDTLAAAYAEDGEYAKAVEWQTKALDDPAFERAVEKEEMTKARERLDLYKQGKPFHDQ